MFLIVRLIEFPWNQTQVFHLNGTIWYLCFAKVMNSQKKLKWVMGSFALLPSVSECNVKVFGLKLAKAFNKSILNVYIEILCIFLLLSFLTCLSRIFDSLNSIRPLRSTWYWSTKYLNIEKNWYRFMRYSLQCAMIALLSAWF